MVGVLERGDIYFLYRPPGDGFHRFYVVLHPRDRDQYRRLVVGRLRTPVLHAHERHWAFVDRVVASADQLLDELREIAPIRAAGEGVYAIVEHERHSHFAYRLELPARPGTVLPEVRIDGEASYVAAVRNPATRAPPGVGLAAAERPRYPAELKARFGQHRRVPLTPDFLEHVGTELVLIGSQGEVAAELGIELDPERERIERTEVFTELALDRSEHAVAPLI
jgi:hypothetical protein